jgi:S1-C subfamily serine protease
VRAARIRAAAAIVAASAAVGAGAGAGAYAVLDHRDPAPLATAGPVEAPPSATPAAGESAGATAVYERVKDSVVEVTTAGVSADSFGPFGGGEPVQGVGSGFVVDGQGHVVTNQHVVDGAQRVTVTYADGSEREAQVVGTDPSTDLAVLKVSDPPASARPLQLADPSSIEVGEPVIAIGSPYGLEGTLTAGVVSALDRDIRAPNGRTITGVVQTDAAINHGNSGGPLLDAEGRVIGVNAQIESESGGSVGIGFAIPSGTVRSVVGQLVQGQEVKHPYLGVEIATVSPDAAADMGAPRRGGVALVGVVEGSPADRAGLKAATGSETRDGVEVPSGGDLVTAVDGEAVESSEDLQSAIAARKPGEKVTLTVYRDGQRRTVAVTVGTQPS